MEEAERLCDRIIIVDHGKVIASDTLQGLYRLLPASNLLLVELDDAVSHVPLDNLRAVAGVRTVERHGSTLRFGLSDLASNAAGVLQWLVDHSCPYRHVFSERATLETVFLTLTGRSLR